MCWLVVHRGDCYDARQARQRDAHPDREGEEARHRRDAGGAQGGRPELRARHQQAGRRQVKTPHNSIPKRDYSRSSLYVEQHPASCCDLLLLILFTVAASTQWGPQDIQLEFKCFLVDQKSKQHVPVRHLNDLALQSQIQRRFYLGWSHPNTD